MVKLLSTKEAAEYLTKTTGKHIDVSHIKLMCANGRIKGAKKVGWSWVIPSTALREDPRKRYADWKRKGNG
jgi:hypothetical protein